MVMNTKNRFATRDIPEESVMIPAIQPARNAYSAAETVARGGRDILQEIEYEMRAAATANRVRARGVSENYLALLLIAGSRALHQQRCQNKK